MMKKVALCITLITSLFGDEMDELLEGFDDTSKAEKKVIQTSKKTKSDTDELLLGFDDIANEDQNQSDDLLSGFDEETVKQNSSSQKNFLQDYGIEGKLTQSLAYSYKNDAPHDDLSSFKSSLFLEYNKELWDDMKIKINGVAFYDLAYLFKGREKFTQDELDDLESEVELYDAYLQTSLSNRLDLKLGRQVVVWGKSDTIRITDVINPLDNRRPAMTDIEDLRLPEAMVKFDYYYKNYRVTPIVILEQRFNKNPPFGGDFNPLPQKMPKQKEPNSPSYALNFAGEFSGFDIDLYLSSLFAQDELGLPMVDYKQKVKMAGVALNFIYQSWLFKSELAYKKDFKFLQSGDKKFNRFDSLLGFEYNGIAETKLSFDIANRHMTKKNSLFEQDSYQYAFRATSDFLHATLHTNYLISLFGKKLDEGGFQRVWIKYDIADGINANIGVVDYIGGNKIFDMIKDNDMIFADISYNF